ncbi:MAG: glycosyltransferase family 2 protein [Gammaproteobacteria bacterium]|nr:glycosyltransferase family 2 protein [Gammaproteobacteria bacterium]
MLSVVIPAHNEGNVIERCLSALLDGLQNTDHEIIVVCNGCTDDTANRARAFPSVLVIELVQASKIAALNTGMRAASGFPLAFVDADVELRGRDLLTAARHLETPGIKIVAPGLHVDLARSSWPVRCFYRVWTQLPYFADRRMVGSGVFILAESGRARFSEFPSVIADDGFIRAIFARDERLTATECQFRVFAPKTLGDLIRIKTRVRLGNIELNQKYPNLTAGKENTPGAMASLLLRQPWLIGAVIVYIFVQWRTRQEAEKRRVIADFSTWERDESSRI